MLLTTCFTPLTFLATFSALDFRLFASTEPASVTTPCFTVTSRDSTPTSWSPASLTRTASLIVSSVICGGSFAKQTACIRNSARKAANILCIIFSGHCTPVQGIEKAAILPPVGLHANVQVQIDLQPEQPFHFLAGLGADLLQHGAAGADHNRLLPVPLQVNGGVDGGHLGLVDRKSVV